MSAVLRSLLHQLDLAFDVRSWHGPNLMGSLRGVDPGMAAWRPQAGRHNIHDLVVHAAYWKYRVCRLLATSAVPDFELKGSDFFERPAPPTAVEWKADQTLLKVWHGRLKDAAARVRPRHLDTIPAHAEFTNGDLILGAAAHDLYHAGQIRLIRRMYSGDR